MMYGVLRSLTATAVHRLEIGFGSPRQPQSFPCRALNTATLSS